MAIGKVNTGGGGSGGTLTVTDIVGHTITATKDGKTYTRTFNRSGVAVFKGLSTGTWTLTMTGDGQTATRTVTVNADYAVTITYFAATINITYPANSNCVVKNSGGQTVASDTNTASSEKTFTATVGATGTYTVTATATDGSGKTRSTTVSITTDGQSSSVTLKYSLDIIVNGKFNQDVTGSWSVGNSGPGSMGETSNGYVEIYAPVQDNYSGSYTDWASGKALPASEYTTLYVDYSAVLNGYASQFLAIGGVSVVTNSTSSDARNTRAVDISGLTADYQLLLIARAWAGDGAVTIRIYNLYFE